VVTAAPRISRRLIEELVRLDDERVPIAETYRRVAAEAERLGLTRPSYQRIRELVHQSRQLRRGPSTASVLLDVTVRARPPDAFLEHISGVGVPEVPRSK
jgi:hypothetical protein